MNRSLWIQPPFFEIGPKNYLYGQDVVELAKVAEDAAQKYKIRVIYTTPYVNISTVAAATKDLLIFAPHMDSLSIGRGLADILPESLKAAGAHGVMLNHAEKPIGIAALNHTLCRARMLHLMSIVCASQLSEAAAVAALGPDMIVSEPAELIGAGHPADMGYVKQAVSVVRSVSPDIRVLVGGGVSSGQDAYDIIFAGADATGSSSGIVLAKNPEAMVYEMLQAVREAWDKRQTLKNQRIEENDENYKPELSDRNTGKTDIS